MIQRFCPLCDQPGCLMVDSPSGADLVSYECRTTCGTFRMGNVFLKYVWPCIPATEQEAIVAYLQATKGPQRAAPLIRGDNYLEYISHGRRLQQRVTAASS